MQGIESETGLIERILGPRGGIDRDGHGGRRRGL